MEGGMMILASGIGLFVITVVLMFAAILIGRKKKQQMKEYLREWY